MTGMMLHCGGKECKFDELNDFDIPENTRSYCAVPHHDLMSVVHKEIYRHGFNVTKEHYAVAKSGDMDGARLFSLLSLDSTDNGNVNAGDSICPQVAIRNSYDKSIAVGFAAGSNVFICDNLIISGQLVAVRRHTTNVWNDLAVILKAVLSSINEQHQLDQEMREAMMGKELTTDFGLDVLGIMAAHHELSITSGNNSQFGIAIREWETPQFEEFELRTLWSLYNACTYAAKKSSFNGVLDTGASITKYFRNLLDPETDIWNRKANEIAIDKGLLQGV